MKDGKDFTTKKANWGTLGGDHKMHGFKGAGPQKPGISSQEGDGGRREFKPQAGGQDAFVSSANGGAANKDFAGTQEPGTTGPTKKGGDNKFATGGTTKMHGNSGSQRAIGGQTAPN